MPTSEIVVSCRDLKKQFSSSGVITEVIRGVDLEINRGDYTVLMGGSGSGKSSLLYLLSGLDAPSAGSVHFNGQSLTDCSETKAAKLRRRGMGFVFQAFNLIPTLTLIENIHLAGHLGAEPELESRCRTLLAELDLGTQADKRPSQLSGGQQQRGAIARALINHPEVLFADEPTGALNSAAGESVLDLFDSLSKNGQTIFMVTHELRAASRGDRVLYMQDGELVGDFRFQDPAADTDVRERQLFGWLTEQGW